MGKDVEGQRHDRFRRAAARQHPAPLAQSTHAMKQEAAAQQKMRDLLGSFIAEEHGGGAEKTIVFTREFQAKPSDSKDETLWHYMNILAPLGSDVPEKSLKIACNANGENGGRVLTKGVTLHSGEKLSGISALKRFKIAIDSPEFIKICAAFGYNGLAAKLPRDPAHFQQAWKEAYAAAAAERSALAQPPSRPR